MESLLERTREITRLLQNENILDEVSNDLPYDEIAITLADIMECNTYILSESGVLLGYRERFKLGNRRLNDYLEERQYPVEYTEQLLYLRRTKTNIPITDELSAYPTEVRERIPYGLTTIVPIIGAGKRLGTILLSREDRSFQSEDLILAEYSAAVVGMQIMYQKSLEREEEVRKKTAVDMALHTLSYSELKAVKAILGALDGDEGRLTASQIADEIGITRSVIVNALRKLESAGIIESRSLGMKGTYLKILIPGILEELDKQNL